MHSPLTVLYKLDGHDGSSIKLYKLATATTLDYLIMAAVLYQKNLVKGH